MAKSEYALSTKVLRRSQSAADYLLYRAGLEWSLIDPIIIDSRADLKSEPRWRGRIEPFNHQVTNLINFCRRLPVTLLADDVGLGKTISAGLVASELVARRRIEGILIVAPKLLGPQWKEELEMKFGISASIATGRELLDAEPNEGIGAVITTYNSARLYLERLPQDRFQMLVLDEAHKLRNLHGVPTPPKVALTFRQVLLDRRFKFVLMLTATPIQNRLWDLYSLVDLLTVARGHTNPFGTTGEFARNFIADKPNQARQLRPDMRDQFRSIVYGYMSRVRRADAKLHFPDRNVVLQRAMPTAGELDLIRLITVPIQSLNRLVQISILQALTSSPHALAAQLETMARKGTVPEELALNVRAMVRSLPDSAKLQGLAELVSQLRRERPVDWRMVVFTCRRETQTTIESYLRSQGITVGTINGDSGGRNSETITQFRQNPPAIHVIVSTEAGSEGVNLQAANVLVNFDLPWNPMIVEQRIGRVQRLASEHASVSIYNVILADTFEEYIVGRLVEKLQTISHAIGDIESLLEASGMADGEGDGSNGFEEQIRKLVIDSLSGKDVAKDMALREQSIADAKATLEAEERAIDEMLGPMDDSRLEGPRSPSLPQLIRSMDAPAFTIAALQSLGARVEPRPDGLHNCTIDGQEQVLSTAETHPGDKRVIHYAPGTPAFDRLVSRLTQSGTHDIQDADRDALQDARVLVQSWLDRFGASLKHLRVVSVTRCFDGTALVQARANVAHDAYERLIEIHCHASEHRLKQRSKDPVPIGDVIERPSEVGLDESRLKDALLLDSGIAEFRRFYLERRSEEVSAAAGDARRAKKLEDDFTPRLTATVVGLTGTVHRELALRVSYVIDGAATYESNLTVAAAAVGLIETPELRECTETGRSVPVDCLAKCEISGSTALRHVLAASAISDRLALPSRTVICAKSGKRVLEDEAAVSTVTGLKVERSLLTSSAVSGCLAEPENCTTCAFTGGALLPGEVAVSEISGKPYRADQQARSAVSGKTAHKSEFVTCAETNQLLAPAEGERCAMSNKLVVPGLLEPCSVSGIRVLLSELERCNVSGRMALPKYLVSSSVSGSRLLDSEAIHSAAGAACMPREARPCVWSGETFHPDDLVACALTGLRIHQRFITPQRPARLQALSELLDYTAHPTDATDAWPRIAERAAAILRGRYRIEAACLSADKQHLAVTAEVKTLLGLRVQNVGFVYALAPGTVLGRIAVGKRAAGGWKPAKS
jgi:superfamily II DNA or RNA helicase